MPMQVFLAIFSGYFTGVTNLEHGINVIIGLLEKTQLYRHTPTHMCVGVFYLRNRINFFDKLLRRHMTQYIITIVS
jgi:hypothetical protein